MHLFIKYFNDLKAFIEYSSDMEDTYKNILENTIQKKIEKY